MRVLVIDGDPLTAKALELMLRAENFNPSLTDLGEDGVELAKLYDYDAIVLDLTLPDISGFDVICQIRRCAIKTPIMVISAMAMVEDKVKALGLGADDYLIRPFHKDELIARLNGLVRRSRGHIQSVITVGNLSVNIDAKTATVNGVDFYLTGKEYQLLELLALRKGAVLRKEAFLSHIYGGRDEPEIKIIDVFISKLRKKLKAVGGAPIETVWGRGYVLRDAPKSIDMAPEVASLIDDPPTGFVPNKTFGERRNDARAKGLIKARQVVA